MRLLDTALGDVKLIELDVFSDERGAFAEIYDSAKFDALGLPTKFAQDSWSVSHSRGTVRGFHYQLPPHAQHKIVRVTRGRILDVVLDIRSGSPTFGKHAAFELSAERAVSAFVPAGFAHAFCTLEPNTEVTYKMSDHFVANLYRGLYWADPALQIAWPVRYEDALVSSRDRGHPVLSQIDTPFSFAIPAS